MNKQDYHCTIIVDRVANHVFNSIADIAAWWTTSFRGKAKETGDSFTVQFGETRVKFEIMEAISNKKLVWQVVDSHLHWLKDKAEWTGTKIVWELSDYDGKTRIDMRHIGLVPEFECYEVCSTGWNKHMDSLKELLLKNG